MPPATTTIPASLRGGTGQPPLVTRLSANTASIVKQRHIVLFEVAGPAGPIAPTINILEFLDSLNGPNAMSAGGGGAVAKDTLEQWNIINLTGDTHPMHIHPMSFQLLNRQSVNISQYRPSRPTTTRRNSTDHSPERLCGTATSSSMRKTT